MPRRALSLAVILTFALSGAAPAQPADLNQWVSRAMQAFEVPGIALAIVKDDRVVVARGFGVR
jgi:CubicO group peptidase (beta-lactamase class C family)